MLSFTAYSGCMTTPTAGASATPPADEISDELFERCLRALYHAPPDKPSLKALKDISDVDLDAFRAALAIARQDGWRAGRFSAFQTTATCRKRVTGHGPIGLCLAPAVIAFAKPGVSPVWRGKCADHLEGLSADHHVLKLDRRD